MTSSMLAPANADPSCRSESSSGSSASSAGAACFPVRFPVEVAGSGSLAVASAGNSSSSSSHGKATTTTPTLKQECSGSTTTDTGGLVSPSSSHEYTVHHQPSLRSHVNLLHHNSELSINTLSSHGSTQLQPTADQMQQAAATDYFRPYLHTNPYPHTPGGSVGGVATVHPGHPHMTPMAPHPASMHSPYATAAAVNFNAVHHPGSRLTADPAAAMAAAAAVSAAAAVAANNNSPTYKGYQDLYSNNNPATPMELSSTNLGNDASNATAAASSPLSDQQYPATGPSGGQPRMFPARPQPTRPVMVGTVAAAGSPKPPKDASMQPPPSSPVQLNNNNNNMSLTPPPSVTTHHRSQQSLSKSSAVAPSNSNLGPSAALYRDKLGLNSPSSVAAAGGTAASPTTGIPPPLSPAVDQAGSNNANSTSAAIRRLSGNSSGTSAGGSSAAGNATGNSNPKFRYPSGPSSSSSPPPPATPSSAMSSREGTPLPPTQRPEDGAPPNVDISRVQIAESDSVIKREQPENSQQQSMVLGNAGIKREQSDPMTGMQQGGQGGPPPSHQLQQQQQVSSQTSQQQHAAAAAAGQFGAYSPATSTSPSTFSAQYPYLAQQHQQHHHMTGWQPQHYYSPSPLDGTNNNLMAVRSLQDGLSRTSASAATAAQHLGAAAAASMGGYGSSYGDHQQYQYPTTIHHYGDPTTAAQHSVMASGSTVARSSLTAAGVGRGRGHHHASGGNGVKIGRRPAHLPKVLKFQDKTLPPGWIRKLKCRKHGKQAGRWDVYIYSPCGVKFASKKKLKAFFEKNQLNYDIDEFDFTPYGRHTDSGGSGSRGNSGSGSSSGNATSSGGGSSSGNTVAGRHNSSGSTGSEGTHTGGSPASLHNYSPTHHHALHSSISGSTPTSSSSYMPSMMAPGSTSSLYGSPMATAVSVAARSSDPSGGPPGSNADFSSFSAFDPLMDNPPNKMCPSVEDLPTSTANSASATAAAVAASAMGSATNYTESSMAGMASVVASAYGIQKSDTGSDFFPAEMAEILGSSPSVSQLANGLTGSAFGPPHGLSSSMSDPYSDLSRSLHHPGSLHPLSNASLESRGSTEEEGDESGHSMRPENKVSGLSKAFRALNDFGSVYSFE